MKSTFSTLIFCFIFIQFSFAQMSAGFSLGCINYQGDLSNGFIDPKEVNISYGLFIAKRYNNPKLSLKGHIRTGTITGNDLNYPEQWKRGLKFSSPVTFVGTALEYSPWAKKLFNEKGDFVRQKNVFGSAGFGFTFFNPKVQGLDEKAPDKTAEISKTMFTIPLSVGIRFDMTQEWSFAIEGSYFLPFTDYLDGISAAGTPTNSDRYLFYGLSLTKKWGDMQGFKMANGKKAVNKVVKKSKKRR